MGDGDWIKYGWGKDMSLSYTRGDFLQIDLLSDWESIANTSSLQAAIDAVNRIVKTCPPPYILMCSGGVDSQAMAWAWYMSRHSFRIVSFKYVSNGMWFNEHDALSLIEFSTMHNISIHFIDFDVITFLENKLQEEVIKYDCDSPQICTHIQFIEYFNEGTLIFSGNTIDATGAILSYTLLGLHRAAIAKTQPLLKIIPFFFLHTPELAYSLRQGHISKNDCYSFSGYPIVRPPTKFTGFEKIKEWYDIFTDRVPSKTKWRYGNRGSHRIFDLLFRHPYQSMIDDGKYRAETVQQYYKDKYL